MKEFGVFLPIVTGPKEFGVFLPIATRSARERVRKQITLAT